MTTPNQDFMTAAILVIIAVFIILRLIYLEISKKELIKEYRKLHKKYHDVYLENASLKQDLQSLQIEYNEMSDMHIITLGEFITRMEALDVPPQIINDRIRELDIRSLVKENIELKKALKPYIKKWKT